MRSSILLLSVLATVPAAALADTPQSTKSLTVTSSAFEPNQAIPSEFTCEGTEQSPPLSWSNVPSNAKSLAVMLEDPDAPKGTFTHWLVVNIPPSESSLSAGGSLPTGAVAVKNDAGKAGYKGPCPPSGTHHYRFHVYALDTVIQKPADRAQFLREIRGHVLAQGLLVATYGKHAGSGATKPMNR